MTTTAAPAPAATRVARWTRGNAMGVVGLVLTALILIMTIFAPLIATHDPDTQDLTAALVPPGVDGHLLGTDQVGRDLFSRVVYGGQAPLLIVATAVVIATVVGVLVGLVAGLRGGWFDQVSSRLADIQLSIPSVLLAITFLAFAGVTSTNLVVVLALATWPTLFRLTRAQAMSLRRMPFVEAATMSGGSQASVVLRHLLPNVAPIVIVTATLALSAGLILEAALSFLGLGVQQPTADWGQMVAAGQTQLGKAWWLSIAPGAALLLLLLGIQLTGDWLSGRFSVQGLVKNGG